MDVDSSRRGPLRPSVITSASSWDSDGDRDCCGATGAAVRGCCCCCCACMSAGACWGDAAGALGAAGGGAADDIVAVVAKVAGGGENADLKSGWIWASGSDEPRAPAFGCWLWLPLVERAATNADEAAYAMLFAAASAVESCAGCCCSVVTAVCAFVTPFAAAASTCFWRARRLASASKSSKVDEATGTLSV